MIIILSDSFFDIDFERNVIARTAIETICQSVSRGEHFVFSSRKLAVKLAANSVISKTARGIMEWLRSEYTYIAGLVDKFRYRVEVCAVVERLERTRGATQWKVPIKHIADYGVRPTVLLAENTLDGEFYRHAANHFLLQSDFGKTKLKIELQNGNGAGISKELERLAREATAFCLCVSDSDKQSPDCGCGKNSRDCNGVEEGTSWVVHHISTFGRELENTIPRNLFAEIAEENSKDEWDDLTARRNLIDRRSLNFADLKDGLTLEKVFSYVDKSPYKIFWVEQAGKMRGEFKNIKDDCLGAGECRSKNDCGCVVIPRFGAKVAGNILDKMTKRTPHESYARSKKSENIDEWLELGWEVLQAGVAPPRMRL